MSRRRKGGRARRTAVLVFWLVLAFAELLAWTHVTGDHGFGPIVLASVCTLVIVVFARSRRRSHRR